MISPISIIIPVYNAEKYLKRCLDSIKEQTFANWETILIDDGSTDNSGKICDEYSETDNRFTVIHQHNKGASTARNTGIDQAKGDWITFIDADDYVERNYLESLCVNIENEKTLIIQGLKQVNSKGEEIKKIDFGNSTLYGNQIQKAFDEKEIFEYGYTVAKLYNRNIIEKHNIRFNEQIFYSEDMLFMLEYILNCDTIKFIGGANYNYITDISNLSQRYNSFESEYLLFTQYAKTNQDIANKRRFTPSYKSQRYGALILMRSIYSLFVNKDRSRKERYNIIYNIRKEKYTYIKKYYKPQIPIFKAIKLALLIHPIFFDIICKIKFK